MSGVGTLTLILGCLGFTAVPDSYRVTVTRKEANLYQVDRSKTYIKTKYCYEYVYSEQAILVYERGSLNNKLIFDKRSGRSPECSVENLLQGDR
jgi:hypothetical protein